MEGGCSNLGRIRVTCRTRKNLVLQNWSDFVKLTLHSIELIYDAIRDKWLFLVTLVGFVIINLLINSQQGMAASNAQPAPSEATATALAHQATVAAIRTKVANAPTATSTANIANTIAAEVEATTAAQPTATPNVELLKQLVAATLTAIPTPNLVATLDVIAKATDEALPPTPNIAATIQQAVKVTLTALPTPILAKIPTPIDTPKLGIGSRATNRKDGAVYVYVPAGKFVMGSNDGKDDEKPVHEVTQDAFWIMQTEVTNAEYKKCMDAGFCSKPGNSDWDKSELWTKFAQHPVVHVNWDQANTYAKWAGGHLPTEAEWEKTARGPYGNTYPWGNTMPNNLRLNFDDKLKATNAIGQYLMGRSFYGAFDMAGNVWEWVADWYDWGYYEISPTSNPQGPTTGSYHVIRGGSYRSNANTVRSSYRYGSLYGGNVDVGFRVVRDRTPE